jgi:DNA-binding SARP family transcriptional activator/tetratricopeptide (TPR) repeat protein
VTKSSCRRLLRTPKASTGSTNNQGQYQPPQRAYTVPPRNITRLQNPPHKYVSTLIATSRKSNVNAVLRFRLLGVYTVALNGEPVEMPRTLKARSLLAYLALRRGETLRRESLMNEFWPDADPQSARNNLKTTLSAIRKVLRDGGVDVDAALVVTRDFVRWEAAVVADSLEFARCSLEVDDERRYAIEIYGGEFMPGDDNEWAQYVRRELAMRFEQMLRRELAASPSPPIAERLLALDPFSDEAYTSLIEHALHSGDRQTARAIYRRYEVALRELDVEPPRDLAIRVGMRASSHAERLLPSFFGRADELAELAHHLNTGKRAVLITGVAGIGKTALANTAVHRFGIDDVEIVDAAQWRGQTSHVIVCARPDAAETIRSAATDLPEVEVGALTYDELAVAIRRHVREDESALVDAVWKRSNGYPLVLAALGVSIEDEHIHASTIERMRLPRTLERKFETLLRALPADVTDVAVLLGLEPQLDHDDLAALLNWNVSRVIDARDALKGTDAAYPFYVEAALRTISPFRREHTIDRIAERLKLHEDPSAKARSAELLNEVGKKYEASNAYFEAATGFIAASAWESAARVVDAGIETLEPIATSAKAIDTLRALYMAKGSVHYQQGLFVAALHAFDSVMELSTKERHQDIRTRALLSMGHALVRADMLEPAWAVAQQAVAESASLDPRTQLGAQHLLGRVLRDQLKYDEAVTLASRGYEQAMQTREWVVATGFSNLVIEIHRRLLKFDAAFLWAQRQLEAAVLAGPALEAEARHMLGSVKATVHRFDEAVAEFSQALALVERYQRRQTAFVTPVRQLEWQLHHALAHVHVSSNDVERALIESEWLLRSPWLFNVPFSSWQAASVSVDARLAAGSESDVKAAQKIVERLPKAASQDPRACIDTLARARIAARSGWDSARALLREAYEQLTVAAAVHEDQIHPYFYRLAESAKDLDDIVARKALQAARYHEGRVMEQAGELWGQAN